MAIVLRATEQYDRLPELVAELVRLPVAVIYASGSINAALAAKAATATIPIVFANGGDPVSQGLVASMNRPGGNITGVTFLSASLTAKRLELLRELVPQDTRIGFLVNPTSGRAEADVSDMETVARAIGQEIIVVRASNLTEIETAFATMAERRPERFSLAAIRSSPGDPIKSLRSRRATGFRRAIHRALPSTPAA